MERPAADDAPIDLEAARSYLAQAANDTSFSGIVLVGLGDEVVLEQAHGWADADLGVPMSTEHRFRIGSLTKPITAAAILIAVDRGIVELETPVCGSLTPGGELSGRQRCGIDP